MSAELDPNQYSVQSLSTRDHAPAERGEWWRHVLSCVYSNLDLKIPDDYSAGMDIQESGEFRLLHVRAGAADYVRRTESLVRRAPMDAYELIVPIAEQQKVSQGDDKVVAQPGNIVLASFDQPTEVVHEAVETQILLIPRAMMDPRLLRPINDALELDAGSGIGRLVIDALAELHRERTTMDGATFVASAERIVDMLALAYNSNDDPNATDRSVQRGLVATIRRVVRAHLLDLRLDEEFVAARIGWDLPHVENQLRRAGTSVATIISEERRVIPAGRAGSAADGHPPHAPAAAGDTSPDRGRTLRRPWAAAVPAARRASSATPDGTANPAAASTWNA